MSIHIQTISELNNRARRVLIQELGVVDAMRFLNQFRAGEGNYTDEREKLFENESVADLLNEIKARRTEET